MILDRAFALLKTAMFGPRYLRHTISNLSVAPQSDGTSCARANFMVFEVLLVGEYRDVFVRVDGTVKLRERRCIYDNLLIQTALCIPV